MKPAAYATGGRRTWSCEVSTEAGGMNCHMETPGYPMNGTNLLPTTWPGAENGAGLAGG